MRERLEGEGGVGMGDFGLRRWGGWWLMVMGLGMGLGMGMVGGVGWMGWMAVEGRGSCGGEGGRLEGR